MNRRYNIFEPRGTQIEGHSLTFWVTVTRDLSLDKYRVDCCTHLHTVLKRMSAYDSLLYVRAFADMHLAIGHKLFLESLSVHSMVSLIRCENPNEEDLSTEMEKYSINQINKEQ